MKYYVMVDSNVLEDKHIICEVLLNVGDHVDIIDDEGNDCELIITHRVYGVGSDEWNMYAKKTTRSFLNLK